MVTTTGSLRKNQGYCQKCGTHGHVVLYLFNSSKWMCADCAKLKPEEVLVRPAREDE